MIGFQREPGCKRMTGTTSWKRFIRGRRKLNP